MCLRLSNIREKHLFDSKITLIFGHVLCCFFVFAGFNLVWNHWNLGETQLLPPVQEAYLALRKDLLQKPPGQTMAFMYLAQGNFLPVSTPSSLFLDGSELDPFSFVGRCPDKAFGRRQVDWLLSRQISYRYLPQLSIRVTFLGIYHFDW